MVAVPIATPVTKPVPDTVATPGLLLLHVPPAVASAKTDVEPTQRVVPPVIATGGGVTVTTIVAVQPVAVTV